jgi:hypothetical protein
MFRFALLGILLVTVGHGEKCGFQDYNPTKVNFHGLRITIHERH